MAAGELEAMLAVAEQPVTPPDPMLRTAILDCRDRLPGKPRQALDARLAAAGSHDDTDLAGAIGMRLTTFLQNFTRARQLLADCLRKRGIILDEELGR